MTRKTWIYLWKQEYVAEDPYIMVDHEAEEWDEMLSACSRRSFDAGIYATISWKRSFNYSYHIKR